MTIDELNALPVDRALEAIRPCADIDRWLTALVAARPFASRADLLAAAASSAETWTYEEVEHALRDHPRIGERPVQTGATAELSRAEQAGMTEAGADLTDRLAEGNRRYEEAFGCIYLVRAAGRSAAELVEILERRLGNDPENERAETRVQLAEIALLRLEGLVGEREDAA